MHSHTKFEIPTSKNIGDMDRTRSGMDRRTDGQCDYFGGIKTVSANQIALTLYKYCSITGLSLYILNIFASFLHHLQILKKNKLSKSLEPDQN